VGENIRRGRGRRGASPSTSPSTSPGTSPDHYMNYLSLLFSESFLKINLTSYKADGKFAITIKQEELQ